MIAEPTTAEGVAQVSAVNSSYRGMRVASLLGFVLLGTMVLAARDLPLWVMGVGIGIVAFFGLLQAKKWHGIVLLAAVVGSTRVILDAHWGQTFLTRDAPTHLHQMIGGMLATGHFPESTYQLFPALHVIGIASSFVVGVEPTIGTAVLSQGLTWTACAIVLWVVGQISRNIAARAWALAFFAAWSVAVNAGALYQPLTLSLPIAALLLGYSAAKFTGFRHQLIVIILFVTLLVTHFYTTAICLAALLAISIFKAVRRHHGLPLTFVFGLALTSMAYWIMAAGYLNFLVYLTNLGPERVVARDYALATKTSTMFLLLFFLPMAPAVLALVRRAFALLRRPKGLTVWDVLVVSLTGLAAGALVYPPLLPNRIIALMGFFGASVAAAGIANWNSTRVRTFVSALIGSATIVVVAVGPAALGSYSPLVSPREPVQRPLEPPTPLVATAILEWKQGPLVSSLYVARWHPLAALPWLVHDAPLDRSLWMLDEGSMVYFASHNQPQGVPLYLLPFLRREPSETDAQLADLDWSRVVDTGALAVWSHP